MPASTPCDTPRTRAGEPSRSGPRCVPFVTVLMMLMASLSLTTLMVGCEPDPPFGSCPLSATILEVCEAEATDAAFSCVVASHPVCLDEVCASWQDSEPFCTLMCEDDFECPDGSTCQTYLDDSFCVPDDVLADGDG